MAEKVLGPTGSPRRRWTLLLPLVAVIALGLFYVAGAQAVHDVGVFQLDQDASTADDSDPSALEDWDLICKDNPSTCTFATGYTVPSGTTLSDPNAFEVDPSESAQDDILKGGTKDDLDISSWKWASAKPSPPKNDITHAFAAEYTCKGTEGNSVPGCTGDTGDKFLYFGADRFSNSGSANLAFWFFNNKITQKLADGTTDAGPGDVCTLGQGCIFGGTHKAGEVPHDPTNVGDILIISAFGPKAQIQVYEWVGIGNAPAPCFTNDCSLVPLIPASAGQACEDVTNDNACATVNPAGGVDSPWTLSQKNAPADEFDATNFFEGGLNLTNLGLAEACFSSFLVNTRASASGDAELHDKILGQFGRCQPNLTTQQSATGEVTPGTAVTDRATIQVTGATSPADATGSVTFFLCGPLAAGAFCSTGGSQVGTTAVSLTNGACSPVSNSNTDGKSCAVSVSVNDSGQTGFPRGSLSPGRYCFRAVADLTNYDDPDPFYEDENECFTVAKTPTSITTAQSWLPQDSATISPAVAGTVVFSLYESADCSGTAVATFTDTSAPFSTNNQTTTVYATPGKTISWSATFTPTDTNTYLGSTTTRCEKSVLTIDDDSGPFPPASP